MSNRWLLKSSKEKSNRERAAAYLRMSTEHQQYSTENQRDTIMVFAEARNLDLVKTYTDEGKSGLRLDGRNSLKALIRDVEAGDAGFTVILVYDVSRWGRFQDPDESASYEIRCKQAGVRVLYCAEQFENDGSPVSSIIKSVKRTMAGEYSRELSVKVHAGQTRLIKHGYRQGGTAGYGLRRQLVDQNGTSKGLLDRGEHKSIQTDRVILVPGPPEELAIIQEIYRNFIENARTETEIAADLNRMEIRTERGALWNRGTVHEVLINEKYIGNNVWNRRSFKLKQERIENPPAAWTRAEDAFEPIIGKMYFEAARQIILARSYRLSDNDMLNALRAVLLRHGYLSGIVIDSAPNCPSSSAFTSRFGSLLRTYSLVGFNTQRDYRYIEINRLLRAQHPIVMANTVRAIREAGAVVVQDPLNDLLTINDEFTVSLVLSRCHSTAAGSNRWFIRFDSGLLPDITAAVRMEADGQTARDYYLLPSIDIESPKVRLGDRNDFSFDVFRFDNLDSLSTLSRRVPIRSLAYGQ